MFYAKIYTQGAEPGYYADGEYGIRIENIVVVREAQTPNNFGGKGFLGFEHVTVVRFLFLTPTLSYFPLFFRRRTDTDI